MKKLLLLVAVLALLTPALAQQAGLKATFDTLWVRIADGESIALNLIRAAGDSWAAMPKWWIMQYADSAAGAGLVIYRGYGFADSLALIATGDTLRIDPAVMGSGTVTSIDTGWGVNLTTTPLTTTGTVYLDTIAADLRWLKLTTGVFRHDNPADSSETLYAKSASIDTTAPRAGYASTVAGNAWVRDTAWAGKFWSQYSEIDSSGLPPRDTIIHDAMLDGDGLRLVATSQLTGVKSVNINPRGRLLDFYEIGIANDTNVRHYVNGQVGFWELYKAGHLSVINWDGFENVDTVNKDVSGNPLRRAFHGWAWNDTGMTNDGTGFAGIWEYESTRVVAMAESANGGTNSFVATIGSATGNRADTSYMSSTLGFYTNTAAGFIGPGAVVPGTVIDWYGDSSAFPTGYVLCDGTRKFKTAGGDSLVTPDLRNFFVVGASIDTGNGIPMSSIEDTTGAVAKATGGSQKYTPAGATSEHTKSGGADFENGTGDSGVYESHTFTGTRAVLVQPYVACWKLVKSRTY